MCRLVPPHLILSSILSVRCIGLYILFILNQGYIHLKVTFRYGNSNYSERYCTVPKIYLSPKNWSLLFKSPAGIARQDNGRLLRMLHPQTLNVIWRKKKIYVEKTSHILGRCIIVLSMYLMTPTRNSFYAPGAAKPFYYRCLLISGWDFQLISQ